MSWVTDQVKGGDKPLPRFEHAMCDTDNAIIVHGGRAETSIVYSDLFYLDYSGVAPTWTVIDKPFPPRYGHQLCRLGQSVFLFGGRDENHAVSNALFSMDLSSHEVSRLQPQGVGPSPRSHFSFLPCPSNNGHHLRVVLYGGQDASDRPLHDIYVLEMAEDGKTLQWTAPETTGTGPGARWGAAVWTKAGYLYVAGGSGENGFTSDMFSLDLTTWVWSPVQQKGEVPPATQRYHTARTGNHVYCVGEKGPLRVFFVDLEKKYVKWESYKATGALPSLTGFSLSTCNGTLFLGGGKPFLGKDREMVLWMLDLASVVGGSVSLESSHDTLDSKHKQEKPEKNRYGTLRNMFSRKSISSESPTKGTASGSSSPSSGSATASPQKSRKLHRGSVKEDSPKPPSEAPSPVMSHTRTKSVDASSGELLAKSPKTKEAGNTISRADSMSRFSSPMTTSSIASSPQLESPISSPGRTSASVAFTDDEESSSSNSGLLPTHASASHAAALQERIQSLTLDLELERKKSAALREEMDKVTGKSDASVLVRKALEEEVKHTGSLKVRIEALEKDLAAGIQDRQMLNAQVTRLKKMIADQGKQVSDFESKITAQTEALKESKATILRHENTIAQHATMMQQLEEERVERYLAELKSRQLQKTTKGLFQLLSFVRNELSELSRTLMDQMPDDAHKAAFVDKFESVQDLIDLQQDRALGGGGSVLGKAGPGLAGKYAASESQDDSTMSDGESASEGDRAPIAAVAVPSLNPLTLARLKPSSSLGSPKDGPASPNNTSSPHVADSARHATMIRELEYRNLMEAPTAFPKPQHDLVLELSLYVGRFRERIKATRGVHAAIAEEARLLEDEFVTSLAQLEMDVYGPLHEKGIVSSDVLSLIFANLPEMFLLHTELLNELKNCGTDTLALFRVFAQRLKEVLEMHDTYAENLSTSLCHLDLAVTKSAQLRRFLAALRDEPPRIMDLRSMLIKPLIHLSCYGELFTACAEPSGTNEEDVAISDMAKTLHSMVAIPVEMLHDRLEQAFSLSKLKNLEIQLQGSSAEDVIEIASTRRAYIDDGEFVVLETDASSRVVNSLLLTLCNDVLIMSKKANERGKLWLHEIIPLSLLQVAAPSDADTSLAFRLSSKAKSSLSYVVHASNAEQLRNWNELLTAASKAAAEFYQSLTSATEDSFSASSSSGWLAQEPDTNLITKYVDSEDICYVRDTASGRVGVRGGKPEALVSWLVNDISGPSAREEVLQFLQACPNLVHAPVILDTAVRLHKRAQTIAQQIRVLNFLSLWVQEFCLRDVLGKEGLASPMFAKLLRFITKISVDSRMQDQLNPLKLGVLRGVWEYKKLHQPPTVGPESLSLKLDLEVIDLEELHPNVFAEQLTVFVHGLLAALSDEDLYQGDKAANVQSMIRFWNELSEWCITYLNQNLSDEAASVQRLRRLLSVAKRCIELKNFDSAFALGLALDSSRLSKAVIESVGKAGAEVIESLNFITNVSRGFSNYRGMTESLAPPAIPYLAIALKDIVLIRENDTYIEGSTLLNYKKLVILGSRFRFFRRYKRMPYGIASIGPVQTVFRNMQGAVSALKSRPASAVLTPTSASAAAAAAAIGSASPSFSGKFQMLRKSMMTGASSLPFFTPREQSGSASARDREREKLESRRPFSARSRQKVSPRTETEGSPKKEASQGSLSSPPDSARAEEAGSNASRWSRALPRNSGAAPISSLTRNKSGSLSSPQPPLSPVTPATAVVEDIPKPETASPEDHTESDTTDLGPPPTPIVIPVVEPEKKTDGYDSSMDYSDESDDAIFVK